MQNKSILGGISLNDLKGVMKDLNQKLDSDDGKIWLTALKKFLRKENPWENITKTVVWKTIKLGTMEKEDLKRKLEIDGHKLNGMSYELLAKSEISDKELEIDLVKIKVSDLGYKGRVPMSDLYNKARGLGYKLCSSEVGPQLRLLYTEQPKGECFRIAMEPIMASDGHPHIFTIEGWGKVGWLGDVSINSGFFSFELNDTFIFQLSKE
jgi:hypothetical protein